MRRRAAMLGVAALLPSALRAEDAPLTRLMQALAGVRERHARFTEEKVIPELDLPLPNEGTLSWIAPDRLEKVTLWPIQERLVVAGGRLTYERTDRGVQRAFALSEQHEMQALVEAIRGTLAGDLVILRQHYEVAFEGRSDGPWRLVLMPISVRLRSAVQRIVVTGEASELLGVDTEGSGGTSRMRITPAP
ncbi:LolA family protein [Humitalea sp. 24SJ18S-53]|uniref:LolA family protein n=1 Tax=Humitalea sp. 24SJ18S-53 TaxID=3422307 RepID=UPI003D673F1A